jgi:ribosomal protein L37AE/L43A
MNIENIKECPSCESKKLKYYKKYIICDDCKSKIGITRNKIWYEKIISIVNDDYSN